MELLKTVLEQQPMAALFLTIAIGYLVGQINIKGLSFGVGAVLFVALAIGWFAPKAVPPPMLGTLGLALFLYAVGIQYGKEFFRGLVSAEGRRANLIAIAGVLCASAASLAFVSDNVTIGHALGMFAGSGTSTAALQAAMQALGNDDPAVGYSVAYPFGVAGPILFLYFAFALRKRPADTTAAPGTELLEIAVADPGVIGKQLGEVIPRLPDDVQIVAVRRAHHNEPADPHTLLERGTVLLAVSSRKDALEQARIRLGEAATGRIANDRSDLDFVRVFCSRSTVVGHRLGELAHSAGIDFSVMNVRRGDLDLLGRPDLMLEFGDRVGVLAGRGSFPAVRKFFGDSIKSTAEFSYISIGVGMALGLLIGALHIPVPGVGAIALGLAGVLVVALVLGKLRRTGTLSWTIPIPANLVLRNLGLTLFLAQVGMSSGPTFAATVAQTGVHFLGMGAAILAALVLPILGLGRLFRMPYDQVAGIVAGACGNPAILSYANKIAPTDRTDLAYAMIFPGMTILKILFVDIVAGFFIG